MAPNISSTPLALWQAGHLTHIGGRSFETVSCIGSPFEGAVGINQRSLNIGDRHAQGLFRFAHPTPFYRTSAASDRFPVALQGGCSIAELGGREGLAAARPHAEDPARQSRNMVDTAAVH